MGCLFEKERTTPEVYPLSLNSLVTACNQSTNREPVVSFDDRTVEEALFSLRQKKLVTVVSQAGSRVQKYRHNFLEYFDLQPREIALLCVLLLRGAQTPGELRARTERLSGLATIEEIEHRLEGLAAGDSPLVQVLTPRPGQKERRYVQLLSDESVVAQAAELGSGRREEPLPERAPGAMEALKSEVGALKADLEKLREEFAAFKKQFE
ncbi:MAG: YceH family protein [Verrucomicrobiota bacterium]